MNIEVLLSTMNVKNENEFIKLKERMNIKGKIFTVNQITNDNISELNQNTEFYRINSYREKGLSKSRNRLIKKAKGDICVIADDDVTYNDNYEEIIKQSYLENPEADCICFFVKSNNKQRKVKKRKNFKINFLTSMRITSFQITFKRESFIKNKIRFDEIFGAGSTFQHGEETIMLCECLKKKMKLIYLDKIIGEVKQENSTWFKGFTDEYFRDTGAVFYRMTKKWYWILIIQFAIRKYKYYYKQNNMKKAIRFMYKGVKDIKNLDKVIK